MTLNKQVPEAISLSDWTRKFAEYTGFLVSNPPLTQVTTAIATRLSTQLLPSELDNLDAQKLLENELGIAAIVKIGTERIGWRTVRNRTEAEVLQIAYSSLEYNHARDFLDIDTYWLLLVNPQLLQVYTRGDLYEAHMAAYDDREDGLECIIVNL